MNKQKKIIGKGKMERKNEIGKRAETRALPLSSCLRVSFSDLESTGYLWENERF
jgi:hypothetical protein